MAKSYAERAKAWKAREKLAVAVARAEYAQWVERQSELAETQRLDRITRLVDLGADRRMRAAVHLFAKGHEPSWRAGGRCAECDRKAIGYWVEEVSR